MLCSKQLGRSLLLQATRPASRSASTPAAAARCKWLAPKYWPKVHVELTALTVMATVQSDIFKPTKFGGKYTVTLIPGDGIGAEVSESVKEIFKADNVPIDWEQVDVSGVDTGDMHAEELFREAMASLKRNKLGLKGLQAALRLHPSELGLMLSKASCTHP